MRRRLSSWAAHRGHPATGRERERRVGEQQGRRVRHGRRLLAAVGAVAGTALGATLAAPVTAHASGGHRALYLVTLTGPGTAGQPQPR